MKNYLFIAIASLLVLASCNTEEKNDSAVRQRDSLLTIIDERDNSVNEFIISFNDLERNLDSVSAKQHLILINSNKLGDANINQKTRINNEILAINNLMSANTKTIKQLRNKLSRSDKKNVQLENAIATLNNQLELKFIELRDLNEKLNALNAQVAQLHFSVDSLSTQNGAQVRELHAAYYIVGKSSDFQKWELIDKEGGLLGLGQTAKVSNNLDMNMFTKIDYLETTVIPVNSKHIKIVSTHPTGSFSLDKTGRMVNSIMINDPEKFWSVSKYLVVTK